ncbi:TfuA-like protein [Paracoccus sp. SSJ]|uniref:TfuA-like protein n=1 Tax=Paracoccus sp. SSJ TaxID=3050636 RepID=UPI00254DFB3A|nr:TfuA-like protein [Paracoccus sp. SSJ]MDK8875009.1 TfuA-like protein [Paracoccus sp. SSJ]
MSVIVFAGPSLRQADRTAFAQFRFLPPVQQGDLYRAARQRPRAIGLIDGCFDGVPAVWHKEVLWAISQGIAVFGASSMGALRAAELAPFGMRGVGRIFRDFHEGRLTDDDEVALLHGPAETGHAALSEPMVNIRATAAAALAAGILDAPAAAHLLATAKALFYQQRDWPAILAAAEQVPATMRDRLAAWLPDGRIDQKRADALEMLHVLQAHVARDEPPPRAEFTFEWTEAWASAPWLAAHGDGIEAGDALMLDALRLQGEPYLRLRRAALLRQLAAETATRERRGVQPDHVAEAALAFRLPRGLLRGQDIDRWAAENGLDRPGFDRLMAGLAGLEALARDRDAALAPAILDQLRLEGGYKALRDRTAKAGTADPPLPLPLLLAWHFHTRLGRDLPEDLEQYAGSLGFRDLAHFHAALARDHALWLKDGQPAPDGTAGRQSHRQPPPGGLT